MSDRLSPQREAAIAARRERYAAAIYEFMHPGSRWSDTSMPANWRPDYLEEADIVIAVADAELAAVRAELAHAVPHAREKALKEAARLVENHVPDEVFGRLWGEAEAANGAANAVLDEQQAGAR